MALYRPQTSKTAPPSTGITEFEILKAKHKFLREGEDDGTEPTTWDDKLALKYYDSLYREFAVCDLKHYKSGNFSLRWRTEQEVLDGTGESTCANSRCEFHQGASSAPALTTLELPFAYTEENEFKSALVKVVLCPGCVKKLMWKRRKEKEREIEQASEQALEKEREKERQLERAKADGSGGGGKNNQFENDKHVSRGKRDRRRDADDRPEEHRRSRSGRHNDDHGRLHRSSRKRDRDVIRRSDSEEGEEGRDLKRLASRRHHSSRSLSPRRTTDREASGRY